MTAGVSGRSGRSPPACGAVIGCLLILPGPVARANDSGEPARLEEVLVLARKRLENVQDVPVAVSVRSGEQLRARNAFRVQEIIEGMPNVAAEIQHPRQSSFAIRGLGKNPANDGLEAAVGLFVDGVYLGRPGMLITDLIDLERFEVLRGPQGTLFGKNTIAGTINVITRAPTEQPEGSFEATFGNNDSMQFKGVSAGPIGDSGLAYRLTASSTTRAGFTRDVTTGRDVGELDRYGVRGQLQWRSASATVRLIADYSAQDEDGPGYVLVDPGIVMEDGSIRPNNFLDRAARAGYTPTFDPFARRTDAEGIQRMTGDQSGVALQADWSLPDHLLTSIASFRHWNFRPHNDGDLSLLAVQPDIGSSIDDDQITYELRLASSADTHLSYVVGAYVFLQQLSGKFVSVYGADAADFAERGMPAHVLDGFRVQTTGDPDTESYAAFGQATWRLSESWEASGGLRWTTEHRAAQIERTNSGGAPLGAGEVAAQSLRARLGGPVSTHVALSEDFISGSATLSRRFGDDLAYASVSHGAKSGGINVAVAPPGIDQVLDPEVATSYELGWKGEWLAGRLRVNAAFFRMDVDDYQSTIRDSLRAATFLTNAGSVRSQGFELEASVQPRPGLELTVSGGWNDAEFTSFRSAPCPPEVVGRTSCDFTGLRVPGAPPWTVGAGVSYEADIARTRLSFYAIADVQHTASYFADLTRYSEIDPYDLVSARLGLRDQSRRWDLSLWARNLLDEEYFTVLQSFGAFNSGVVYGLPGDPRTFGISVRLAY